MLLEKLSICNYGVYKDINTFDLLTSPEKPLIVIGGFNGAGKTTILESMMVALYGRTYFGIKKPKKEYLEYILDKIHRSDKGRANSAFIEIAFRFYHNGSEYQYVVKRSWLVEGSTVSESFSVYKNNELMYDIDESQWQYFIEGLLPLGIAKLFFFDGEKIVRVTEANSQYNKEIKTSIETLIGADIIKQLQSDLNLYILRKSGSKDNGIIKEYEQLRGEKDSLSMEINSLKMDRELKNQEIDILNGKISNKESTISNIGGGYASLRSQLLTQKDMLNEKIKEQTRHIQDQVSNEVPFLLLPSLLNNIKKRIESDIKIQNKIFTTLALEQLSSQIKKALNDPKIWPPNTDIDKILNKIISVINNNNNLDNEKAFFDLSPDDQKTVISLIDKISHNYESFFNLIDDYEKTIKRTEKIEQDISNIPRDDELGPHITEINMLYQDLGLLNGEVNYIDQQISSKLSYKKILQNKLRTILSTINNEKQTMTGVGLASKMQKALDTYYNNLKESKMKELESHLLDTTKLLLHKKNISKIIIDRETFEIYVYEKDNEQIPGDLLSMGERQIIGTALLWAIARTCGRSLPFVIDTPLGRLDGKHLQNLIDHFYPVASHQLILLSTDREIGWKEYQKLSPFLSSSYRITCDESKSITNISLGYFGGSKIASIK